MGRERLTVTILLHEFEANPCLGPIDEETGLLAHVKDLNASLHQLHDLLFAVLKGLLQLLVVPEEWAIRLEEWLKGSMVSVLEKA